MRVTSMMKHEKAQAYVKSKRADSVNGDVVVNITLYRVPGHLVREFARNIAANYQGGMSEAVQDLMKKALEE